MGLGHYWCCKRYFLLLLPLLPAPSYVPPSEINVGSGQFGDWLLTLAPLSSLPLSLLLLRAPCLSPPPIRSLSAFPPYLHPSFSYLLIPSSLRLLAPSSSHAHAWGIISLMTADPAQQVQARVDIAPVLRQILLGKCSILFLWCGVGWRLGFCYCASSCFGRPAWAPAPCSSRRSCPRPHLFLFLQQPASHFNPAGFVSLLNFGHPEDAFKNPRAKNFKIFCSTFRM